MAHNDTPEGFIEVSRLGPASALCQAILKVPGPALRAELLHWSQQLQGALGSTIHELGEARRTAEAERDALRAFLNRQYSFAWHN